MSNYDRMLAQAQALFLEYDQEAIIRRWDLAHDGDYLYAEYLTEALRIDRRTGGASTGAPARWAMPASRPPGNTALPASSTRAWRCSTC